ncbi:TPA: citrate lyase acyl carrier protein [candidate division WOR-3 bacterium]|uniref:Citrate lyase acyl carrier protein n=1 Tax=candidate division WOR-3 bacterium TaxID=2052148 RepID=A0A350HA65_UNCW3|nr:citrate lyase acyl carrier protein [candidate division WOR-3 bacterium]
MDIKKTGVAGSESKQDVLVKVEPGQSGLEVRITSSLGRLYYTQIASSVDEIANKYGIANAIITVIDSGALDYVIRARTESAILRASQEIEKKFYSEKREAVYKLRRTRLYLPGSNPYLMQGITYYNADGIILDLEDAVSLEDKDSARMLVSYALRNIDFGKAEKMVRINSLDVCGAEDIEAILPHKPDVILIPKCESEYDVKKVSEILEKTEKRFNLYGYQAKIMPIIESAKGVENAYEIAGISDRTTALAFGAEDYTVSLGVRKTEGEDELLFAKQSIVNAAKAAGIQASDTVYSNIEDTAGLKRSTEKSKILGFDGRGVIHPSQIDIVHSVFQPSEKEIEEAKEIIEVFNKAKEDGSGVVKHKGKMIDMPIVLRAMRVMSIYKTINQE